MHTKKHQLLAQIPGLAIMVQTAAVQHRSSVDDIVHAALGRPVSPEAKRALAALDPEVRGKLAAMPWPLECPCGELVMTLIACETPGCPTRGCEHCAFAGPCDSCRKVAADVDREKRRKEAMARSREEAAAKRRAQA